jgi:hypothetical protein
MAVVRSAIFDEILEFIVSTPTLEEMLDFRPSQDANQRIEMLLEHNRNGTLSEAERVELDEFMEAEHFVRMLKIKAQKKLDK